MSKPGSAYYLNKPCRSRERAALDRAVETLTSIATGRKLAIEWLAKETLKDIATLLETTEAGEGSK